MGKWHRRFKAWATAKQPVSVDEVESIIHRVFGDRVDEHGGTSHRWTIRVPEIKDEHADFHYGMIGVPEKGKSVKAPYLRIAYRAAVCLDLFQDENDEQDDDG
jgi:hypothetical protein